MTTVTANSRPAIIVRTWMVDASSIGSLRGQITRRETLRQGLAAASAIVFASELPVPALAQGSTDVPFTDIPATFNCVAD